MINLISNLQPWIKSPSEIETIHRKFAIINNILQEILPKLFISISHDKEPDQEGAKKVTLQLFWQMMNGYGQLQLLMQQIRF